MTANAQPTSSLRRQLWGRSLPLSVRAGDGACFCGRELAESGPIGTAGLLRKEGSRQERDCRESQGNWEGWAGKEG